jgi:predicted PurR-regulated permease PerM
MLAAVMVTLLILVILLVPTALLVKSMVEGIQIIVTQFRDQPPVIPRSEDTMKRKLNAIILIDK